MFKYAAPVFLKGQEKEKNITAFFAANFEYEGDKPVILDITGSSVYRVTVNSDTACDSRIKKVMSMFCYETVDITPFVTEGINQIVIECAGYLSDVNGEEQKNFIMAEIFCDGRPLVATGCNFIGFVDAEREKSTEKTENGDYREKYRISGATMIKTNVDIIDLGTMRFKGIFSEYKYSYKNAVKALEKGKFTPYKNVETRYPVTLTDGEYALFDMEKEMEGFVRVAFKTGKKAKIRVSYSLSKEREDGFIDFDVIDGEFERESFHRINLRYIKVTVLEGEAEIHLAGVHKIE
ncbi:MAG: hypothetical protein J6A69_03395 [Clostridia bacterium]|nr:hypothetical protein [Clostridia bacterium]